MSHLISNGIFALTMPQGGMKGMEDSMPLLLIIVAFIVIIFGFFMVLILFS